MNFRSASIGLLLAVCTGTGFAASTSYYNKTLTATSDIITLGFGRSGDVVITDKNLRLSSRSLAVADTFTPGTLPFSFHDIWQFNGLPPGTYSFVDTTINATGNMAFGTVALEWYLPSTGQLKAIDFVVAPDMLSATGSGSFTIESSCYLKGCLFVDIQGWAEASGGYKGTGTLAAVPEPAAGALLFAGLVLLGGLAQRRHRR